MLNFSWKQISLYVLTWLYVESDKFVYFVILSFFNVWENNVKSNLNQNLENNKHYDLKLLTVILSLNIK